MSVGFITGQDSRLYDYQDFSIQCFDSINEFIEYAELAKSKGSKELLDFLERERENIDKQLQVRPNYKFGLKGTDKAPLSYQDALDRKDFVYKDEYQRAKQNARAIIDKALEKNSLANAMKEKMIFTERELGEFIYDRASMSIKPNIFYYSRIHKKELDEQDIYSKTVDGKDEYYYKNDNTEVELCIKAVVPPKNEGEKETNEYYKIGDTTDENLKNIVDSGKIVSISSNVKKVYQFKEKQPRIKNAIKIFMGTSVGGYSRAGEYGDFYTGVTLALVTEYLESRGYSVEIVMLLGGGRCRGCLPTKLNTPSQYGRRFIGITVKKFDEQLDLDPLLYWTADPSALHIKLLRYFNVFHWLYGDNMTYSMGKWHSITHNDLSSPIGTYYKFKDIKKGNKDLLYYFVHQVENESAIAQAVLSILLTSENINYHINQKAINQIS